MSEDLRVFYGPHPDYYTGRVLQSGKGVCKVAYCGGALLLVFKADLATLQTTYSLSCDRCHHSVTGWLPSAEEVMQCWKVSTALCA